MSSLLIFFIGFEFYYVNYVNTMSKTPLLLTQQTKVEGNTHLNVISQYEQIKILWVWKSCF